MGVRVRTVLTLRGESKPRIAGAKSTSQETKEDYSIDETANRRSAAQQRAVERSLTHESAISALSWLEGSMSGTWGVCKH